MDTQNNTSADYRCIPLLLKVPMIMVAVFTWTYYVVARNFVTSPHTESGGYQALYLSIILLVVVPIIVILIGIFIKNKYILIILALLPFVSLLIPQISPIVDQTSYNQNLALQKNNEDYCAKLPANQGACYTAVAIQKDDVTVCDKIISFSDWNDIKYECIAAVARHDKNSNMCMTIPVPMDQNGKINNTNVRAKCLNYLEIDKSGFNSTQLLRLATKYIKSVMPSAIPSDGKTQAIIYGVGFDSSTSAYIESFKSGERTQLYQISINKTGDQITFVIPKGITAGNYKLLVPGDSGVMLQESITITNP